MNIIDVKNITKHYSLGTQTVEALRGISFGIEQGEFIAIMGPSGSGKSTLMNIIGCLDSPTDGTYHLNNQEVSTLEGDELAGIRNKEIGFVFQNFHLVSYLNALENVMLPAKVNNISNAKEKAIELLKSVGLEHRLEHLPSQLSGGEKQRVAIARALIHNPKIILADEPSGNLDEETGIAVMDKLFELIIKNGTTLILVTHSKDVAKRCEETYELIHGNLSKC